MANRTSRKSHSKPSTKRSGGSSSTRSTSSSSRSTKSRSRSTTPPSRRWSAKVKTDSTRPAPGLFKKSAKEIAEGLEKKSVSPEGPGQAMRMLSFYENRGGKNLSAERKHTLENAKDILREKEGKSSPKSSSRSHSRSSSSSTGKTGSKRKSHARSHSRRSTKK
ncbi:MAG TPA: DUF3175 domain-containing protein [Acidobacteriaceae bacterium]|nr:DUF3175 domain-containing protein [Acidobacteriaceae bacterium]